MPDVLKTDDEKKTSDTWSRRIDSSVTKLAYGLGGVDLPRMSSSTATERTVGLSIEVPRTRWSPEEGNCGKRGIVDGAANGQIIQITQQSIHWNQSAGRESSLGRVGD